MPNNLKEELARSIRGVRGERSLRSFATKAGLSYEALRKLEKGESFPREDTLDGISAAADLSLSSHAKLKDLWGRASSAGSLLGNEVGKRMAEKMADAAAEILEESSFIIEGKEYTFAVDDSTLSLLRERFREIFKHGLDVPREGT